MTEREQAVKDLELFFTTAKLYGWCEEINDLIKTFSSIKQPELVAELAGMTEEHIRSEHAGKDEILFGLALLQRFGKDRLWLASFAHHHLRGKLYQNDFRFIIRQVFHYKVPLPRSLVFTITDKIVFSIEEVYEKLADDFLQVPQKNADSIILFLTLQYCRVDLATQNKELLCLVLTHLEAPIPVDIVDSVRNYLVSMYKEMRDKEMLNRRILALSKVPILLDENVKPITLEKKTKLEADKGKPVEHVKQEKTQKQTEPLIKPRALQTDKADQDVLKNAPQQDIKTPAATGPIMKVRSIPEETPAAAKSETATGPESSGQDRPKFVIKRIEHSDTEEKPLEEPLHAHEKIEKQGDLFSFANRSPKGQDKPPPPPGEEQLSIEYEEFSKLMEGEGIKITSIADFSEYLSQLPPQERERIAKKVAALSDTEAGIPVSPAQPSKTVVPISQPEQRHTGTADRPTERNPKRALTFLISGAGIILLLLFSLFLLQALKPTSRIPPLSQIVSTTAEPWQIVETRFGLVWFVQKGENLYLLYEHLQSKKPGGMVQQLVEMSWHAFYAHVRRLNPGKDLLDLIFPGEYLILLAPEKRSLWLHISK